MNQLVRVAISSNRPSYLSCVRELSLPGVSSKHVRQTKGRSTLSIAPVGRGAGSRLRAAFFPCETKGEIVLAAAIQSKNESTIR